MPDNSSSNSSEAQSIQLVARAAYFAAHAHRRQRRKDQDATPYINHLTEVAYLLAEAGCDAEVVAAGYLHDTIEDVEITYEMLAEEFGQRVADLVRVVTDDKALPKLARKEMQVEHAAHAGPAQAALKMADKISNLRSLRKSPPAGWSEERLQEYIDWAHRVVSSLPHRNPVLYEHYEAIRKELLGFPEA